MVLAESNTTSAPAPVVLTKAAPAPPSLKSGKIVKESIPRNPLRPVLTAQHSIETIPFFSFEILKFIVFCTPMYMIRYFVNFFWSLYVAFYGIVPGEKEVVDVFYNSTLFLMVRPSAEVEGAFSFEMNDLKLKMNNGLLIKSIKTVFTQKNVLSFYMNNQEIKDPRVMISILSLLAVGGFHPKIHSTAKQFQNYVRTKAILILSPCLHNTRPLHTFLLATVFSPISKLSWLSTYHVEMVSESVAAEAHNFSEFHHDGLESFEETPHVHFMIKAREAIHRISKEIGLPAHQAEYFFLTSVVHSIDHYVMAKYCAPIQISNSIWGQRWYNYFFFQNFNALFMKPVLNPFFSNLISKMPDHPVFGPLYLELKEINAELADVVTASIMY